MIHQAMLTAMGIAIEILSESMGFLCNGYFISAVSFLWTIAFAWIWKRKVSRKATAAMTVLFDKARRFIGY